MLSGAVLLGAKAKHLDLPQQDILQLDADMMHFVDRFAGGSGHDLVQLQMLISALFSPGVGGMKYSFSQTLTARDTFRQGRGNCLSFSNMLVALSRYAGLDAYYQEVKVPPSWTAVKEENSFLFSRHVNVLIQPAHTQTGVTVDVKAPKDFKLLRARRLTDEEAFAQHFNNIAVDYMYDGDRVNAFRYLKKAVLLAPLDSSLWVNLGTLYRRFGFFRSAEAAYLHAIGLNSNEYVAMSNLAALYQTTGDNEKYEYYLKKTQSIRNRNPFYRYALAKQAFEAGDYTLAENHLLFAIKEAKTDERFYRLMASVQQKLNHDLEAKKYLAIAETLTTVKNHNGSEAANRFFMN